MVKDVTHGFQRLAVMAQRKLILSRHASRRRGPRVAARAALGARRAQSAKGNHGVAQGHLFVDGLQNESLPGRRSDVADDAIHQLMAEEV